MEPAGSSQGSASHPATAAATADPALSEPAAADPEHPLVAQLTRGLETCEWTQLQEKYTDAMDEHSRAEEGLRAETAKLLEVVLPIMSG